VRVNKLVPRKFRIVSVDLDYRLKVSNRCHSRLLLSSFSLPMCSFEDPDMLPHYEYFSESIQDCLDAEECKMVDVHLPPGWLGSKVLPVLQTIAETSLRGMTNLQLSNCSLAADDTTLLVSFIADNETLISLDISKSVIESVDTVKALARAIKYHPYLRHVNLAYCSLGGGDTAALKKILFACKDCDSLDIGHSDFTVEGVAMVAGFLGKKTALTSFALAGAPLDKESNKLFAKSLAKNKSIEKLAFRSNDFKLPYLLDGADKAVSMRRLTHLELALNSLPIQAVRKMVEFFEDVESQLVSLTLSKNRLSTKAVKALLPAIKSHTSLQHLDLSNNWLTDDVAPAVIDLLRGNSDLLTLDLRGNKSLRYGKAQIVRGGLHETTSLSTIADSNHICDVKLSNSNVSVSNIPYGDIIRKINALGVNDSRKIRLKVILAIKNTKPELYDLRNFAEDVPLELMPRLLELVQQDYKYGREREDIQLVYKSKRQRYSVNSKGPLNMIYELVTSWNTPLLFARGAGKLRRKKNAAPNKKALPVEKNQSKRRKRRRFGDENDEEDEPYIPKGTRKNGRWMFNSETDRWERIPPTVV
jgi:hypothetical protein